jgi:hypothetical protein
MVVVVVVVVLVLVLVVVVVVVHHMGMNVIDNRSIYEGFTASVIGGPRRVDGAAGQRARTVAFNLPQDRRPRAVPAQRE